MGKGERWFGPEYFQSSPELKIISVILYCKPIERKGRHVIFKKIKLIRLFYCQNNSAYFKNFGWYRKVENFKRNKLLNFSTLKSNHSLTSFFQVPCCCQVSACIFLSLLSSFLCHIPSVFMPSSMHSPIHPLLVCCGPLLKSDLPVVTHAQGFS